MPAAPVTTSATRAHRLLAVATSTSWCSVALLERAGSDERCEAMHERAGQEHSRRVLGMAQRLLADAGATFADVDAVGFDAGPGAFTGLRIGCGVAQGLGFALEVPVVPVPSLQALAMQGGAERTLVAIDARMGEVYCAAYRREAGLPEAVVAIRAADASSAEALMLGWRTAHGGGSWLAIGDAFGRFPALAAAMERAGAVVVGDVFPQADSVARIAAARLAEPRAWPAASAAPLYVRDKVALDVAEQQRLRAARAPG